MAGGKAKKKPMFPDMKKMASPKDVRFMNKEKLKEIEEKKKAEQEKELKRVTPQSSALFFTHNTQLGPPYHILIDTNFINYSIQNKLDIKKSLMDCLLAKCTVYITDCVIGELEKLGPRFRIALTLAKDPQFERLPCLHKGTYADDCLVKRVEMHKCFIVATCDKDLKRRIRKVPGVPIMYIARHQYTIERLPEAYGAPNV